MDLQFLAVLLGHLCKRSSLQCLDRYTRLLRVSVGAGQEQLLSGGILQTKTESTIFITEVYKAGFTGLGGG